MRHRDSEKGFSPVSNLVSRLTATMLESPSGRAGMLVSVWPGVVGEQVAQHTEPHRLINGLLSVRVDSPVWVTQLTHMKPMLLAAFREKVPGAGVRDMKLIAGSLRRRAGPAMNRETALPPLPPPMPEERCEANRDVADVSDPELREALCRLRMTMLVRKRCG